MSTIVSNCAYAATVLRHTAANMVCGWSDAAHSGDKRSVEEEAKPSFLCDDAVAAAVSPILKGGENEASSLSDEALIKICRQLEFFYREEKPSPEDMASLAQSLVDQSLWYLPMLNDRNSTSTDTDLSQFKIPKVRFGKTELDISIVTCGGMRLQYSWMPDNLPVLIPSRKNVLDSFPQKNIKHCIRVCLALGINHFETARMYGTSEYQMVEALYELIQEGEISRQDFIFQTKLMPGKRDQFLKLWKASWDNICDKLGYVDLLGIHAIKDVNQELEESYDVCRELKEQGKIKHIGFSTHGTSEQIMNLINTEKFEYINIHEHYFGSYHGSGTSDTLGGQGNLACVKRALELDMGVFQISPIDKGGKLYRPSKDCALTIGKDLTPIAFALLYGWNNIGFHTASVGVARPNDLDEVMGAVKIMTLAKQGKIDLDKLLSGVADRLHSRAEEKLGKEWMEKGLLNLPSPFDEASDGIAIGNILQLYNLLEGYGMYEFCRDRYDNLLSAKWDKKKSFEDNAKAFPAGNIGRCYDETVDLTKALENHYNPALALERIKQTHEWLSTDKAMTDKELEAKGWKKAYNLTAWTDIPGELDSTALKKVLLQHLTGGRLGVTGTGPGNLVKSEADMLRAMCI